MRSPLYGAIVCLLFMIGPPVLSAGDAAAEGQATVAPAPEDGGPRRFEVTAEGGTDLRRTPGAESPAISALDRGAILANHGCARAEGAVWCKVQPLGGRARGYVAAALLRPATGPDGAVPMGPDDSLARADAGDFDASGTIPCAQNPGETMGTCTFGVARGTGGDATVVVTFSNGFKRRLSFAHGRFVRADTTMSGTGFDTDWRVEGGTHVVRVEDQRFELPDAALFGR